MEKEQLKFNEGYNCIVSSLGYIIRNGKKVMPSWRNDTGYYVDMQSVSVGENGHEYTVDIAVVKGDSNKVYQYRISLDYGERTYFIHKAVIRTYDTGKVISDEVNDGLAHPYGTMSPMQYIVDYIYAVEHGNKNP